MPNPFYATQELPFHRSGQIIKEFDPYPMLVQNAGWLSVRAFRVETLKDVLKLSDELLMIAESCEPPVQLDTNKIELKHDARAHEFGWTKLRVLAPLGTEIPADIDVVLPSGLTPERHAEIMAMGEPTYTQRQS